MESKPNRDGCVVEYWKKLIEIREQFNIPKHIPLSSLGMTEFTSIEEFYKLNRVEKEITSLMIIIRLIGLFR